MASWNIVQQSIGDKHAVKIKRAFLDRIKLTDIRTNWTLVESVISQGYNAVYNSINWAKWLPGEQVKPAYNEMYNRSQIYLQKYAVKKEALSSTISPESFTMPNPAAEAWVLSWSANEIREITDQDMEMVRSIIANGMHQKLTYKKIAENLRQVIGLTGRQSQAVVNYRKALEDSGKKSELIDILVERYSNRMRKYRAETIALTESHTAVEEAWSDSVTAAVRQGVISPTEYELYWLVASDERLCPQCMALAGATSPPDVQLFKGHGIPPLHPRCRCVTILQRKR